MSIRLGFHKNLLSEQQYGGKGVEYAVSFMEVVKPFIKHKKHWFDGVMKRQCSMGEPIMHSFSLQHTQMFTKERALSEEFTTHFFVSAITNDDVIYQKTRQ